MPRTLRSSTVYAYKEYSDTNEHGACRNLRSSVDSPALRMSDFDFARAPAHVDASASASSPRRKARRVFYKYTVRFHGDNHHADARTHASTRVDRDSRTPRDETSTGCDSRRRCPKRSFARRRARADRIDVEKGTSRCGGIHSRSIARRSSRSVFAASKRGVVGRRIIVRRPRAFRRGVDRASGVARAGRRRNRDDDG